MTILEKKSERKKKAIFEMIKNGEYSLGYALSEVERLSDEGKLIDTDYEELATYIEELLNKETENTETENTEEVQATEDVENAETAENTAENTTENSAENTENPAETVDNVENVEESEVV